MSVYRFSISFINRLVITGLVWLVVLMFVFYGSDALYSAPAPDKPAYDIAAGDTVAQLQAAETAPSPAHPALAERLQHADAAQGAKIFRQCVLCHTALQNGPDRIGPNLWHVVGQPVASARHFNYSRAMQNFAKQGHVWSFATLDAYLAAPARVVPGTIMPFAGIKDEQERADLLLYLESLSDKPAERLPVEKVKNNGSPQ